MSQDANRTRGWHYGGFPDEASRQRFLATPVDPGRKPFVSPGATHIVQANGYGTWVRGDKIKAEDLPEGATSFERLMEIKPYPPVRPLTADEAKGVPPADAPKGGAVPAPPR